MPHTMRAASLPRRMSLSSHHIVMQQGRRVHEFNGGGELDLAITGINCTGRRSPASAWGAGACRRMRSDDWRPRGSSSHQSPCATKMVWLTRSMSLLTSETSASMPAGSDLSSTDWDLSSNGTTTPKLLPFPVSRLAMLAYVASGMRFSSENPSHDRSLWRNFDCPGGVAGHAAGARDRAGKTMKELLRTNDLVLISAVEGDAARGGRGLFRRRSAYERSGRICRISGPPRAGAR